MDDPRSDVIRSLESVALPVDEERDVLERSERSDRAAVPEVLLDVDDALEPRFLRIETARTDLLEKYASALWRRRCQLRRELEHDLFRGSVVSLRERFGDLRARVVAR